MTKIESVSKHDNDKWVGIMRKKKIKTFSVDESVYNELVSMFKKNHAESSLSSYVDSSLKVLLYRLKVLCLEKQKGKYSIPMSSIIDSVVRSTHLTLIDVIEPDNTEETGRITTSL